MKKRHAATQRKQTIRAAHASAKRNARQRKIHTYRLAYDRLTAKQKYFIAHIATWFIRLVAAGERAQHAQAAQSTSAPTPSHPVSSTSFVLKLPDLSDDYLS